MASGEGSNSVFLALNGFKVTAVDFSFSGLNRLQSLAKANQVFISSRLMDVNNTYSLLKLKQHDNVVMTLFKPS